MTEKSTTEIIEHLKKFAKAGGAIYGWGLMEIAERLEKLQAERDKAVAGYADLREAYFVDPYAITPPDAVNAPKYYVLPGGVETLSITKHLSSCGGQAVQYIVRSTRIDGVTKGEEIQDLEKALVFVRAEIERLKGLGK